MCTILQCLNIMHYLCSHTIGLNFIVFFIFFWFQERAAGALANLAADDKCSTEVAVAGGVHALVMLARNCKFEGVQEQVTILPITEGVHILHEVKMEQNSILISCFIVIFMIDICFSCFKCLSRCCTFNFKLANYKLVITTCE